MAFPLPQEASIAVLPFQNLSDDPEQEYFADGLTNDIITDLSRMKDLFVIASNSTFTYKDKPVKVQQVAEELGVRYVLEGSVQRAGDTVRINAQLIDAISGRHLWADRYERNATDLFAVQAEIIETIVATLAFKVDTIERDRVLLKDTENLAAYELYRRAREALFVWTKAAMAEARALSERAIELDPNYMQPYALMARILGVQARYGWVDDPDDTRDLAIEMGRKAVALSPDDYYSHWELGAAYMSKGDFDRSIGEYERALTLNPNDADLLAEMVELLVRVGRAEDAVVQVKSAMRINPHYPDWYLWNLGWAQYFAGQYAEALAALNQMSNSPYGVRRHLAAVLVRLGRIEEARKEIKAFVAEAPDYTLSTEMASRWQHRPYLEKLIDDLRTAGLPE
jgi:adenylate cyclase